MLYQNIKAYIKSYNICLASKTIQYKPSINLQFLLVLTYK